MTSTSDELRRNVRALEEQARALEEGPLRALRDKVFEARRELKQALHDAHPIKVGDRVASVRRKGEFEVTGYHGGFYGDDVGLKGREVLKSGKLHATERNLRIEDGWRLKPEMVARVA